MDMKTTTGISISEEARDILDRIAKATGLSRSSVVEMVVHYYATHSQDFELEHDSDI